MPIATPSAAHAGKEASVVRGVKRSVPRPGDCERAKGRSPTPNRRERKSPRHPAASDGT